jgi:hypothetical protein
MINVRYTHLLRRAEKVSDDGIQPLLLGYWLVLLHWEECERWATRSKMVSFVSSAEDERAV